MTENRIRRPVGPVKKSVTVNAPPDRAFRRFTEEIGSWWPLRSHSVGQDEAVTVIMEGKVGGRIVERIRGGRESVWGTITEWEPPRRVAFTWHPGRDPVTCQDIVVQFRERGDRTQVDLVHSGFERLGPLARKARLGYPLGWTYVLGLYSGRRGAGMAALHGLTEVLMALARGKTKRSPIASLPEGGAAHADT